MSGRLHAIIFAIMLGTITGVTAYALYLRAPGLGCSFYSVQLPRPAESKEKRSETERMIDAGELSNHPAKYYRVLPHE